MLTTACGTVLHLHDESGLDYFGARYYSSAQGRFTTPDEFTGGPVDPFTGQQVGQPGPLPFGQTWDHNSRGQLTETRAQRSSETTPFFRLRPDYGTDANNGNVWSQTLSTETSSVTQYFRYDAANRLRLAVESPASVAAVDWANPTCSAMGGTWC